MAKGRSRAAAPTSFKEEKKKPPAKAKAATSLTKERPWFAKRQPSRAAAPTTFKEEKKKPEATKASVKKNQKNAPKKKAPASATSSSSSRPVRKAVTAAINANRFMTCPETGDRVYVGTATLADMKNPPKGEKRKILLKVPSAKIRQTLFDQLALCLEDRESRLLPKYGGRNWSVICRVNDNANNSSSPFFRWYRGKLELAVLPHLLEKIPGPPTFPGYEQTEHGVRRKKDANDSDDEEELPEEYENLTEEEVERMESMAQREVSALSQVAWDHRNDKGIGAPLPTITIKWMCPLRQIFQSRKAAWDHAVELCKAEQFVDRFIHGRGKNGMSLKPFRPNRMQTLQAGRVRFLRDGLWVVGQEQHWQNDRYRKMNAKQKRQLAQNVDMTMISMEDGDGQPKKRKRMNGSQLFVSVHRVAHQEKRLKELKAQARRKPNKKDNNNNRIGKEEEDLDLKPKSKVSEKVGMPTPPRPGNISNNNSTGQPGKVKFSLADSERELRTIWKETLSDEQRKGWVCKADTSFHRKLYNDDRLRSLEQSEKDEGYKGSDDDEDDDAISDKKPAAKDNKPTDADTTKAADSSDEDDEEEAGQLATYMERALWDVFGEAEHDYLKAHASVDWAKSNNNAHDNKPTPVHPLEPFLAYQRKIHSVYFCDTPENYEQRNLKRLKGPARRQYKIDNLKQKELLAQGMKQLFPASHNLLEKEIGGWLKEGFDTAVAAPLSDSDESERSVATAPDPSGAKFEDEPELKTICPPSAASLESSDSAKVENAPSTPISPSPPPGEPTTTLSTRGSQVQEVATPADDTGKLSDTLNEESAKIHLHKSFELAAAEEAAVVKAEQEEAEEAKKAEAIAAKKKEEEVEDTTIYFEPTVQYSLSEKQVKLCYDACMEHFEDVMRTVKAKDLTRELADGFDVLRERGRGRYDMELPAFDTKTFSFLTDINKAPWMPIVKQVLGDEVVLIHKGCFLSLPDATNQRYHQDGPHLHPNSQRPCHAVNVFTPLVDMTMDHGPTEFCLGSHILGHEDWERRQIFTPLLKKGIPVMFDYRLGHRGLANTSKDPRPIVYCTYARAGDGKEFRDSVNFSRKRYRKLGEMVEKPMSREERNQKRQAQQAEAYDSWWATRYVPGMDTPT